MQRLHQVLRRRRRRRRRAWPARRAGTNHDGPRSLVSHARRGSKSTLGLMGCGSMGCGSMGSMGWGCGSMV